MKNILHCHIYRDFGRSGNVVYDRDSPQSQEVQQPSTEIEKQQNNFAADIERYKTYGYALVFKPEPGNADKGKFEFQTTNTAEKTYKDEAKKFLQRINDQKDLYIPLFKSIQAENARILAEREKTEKDTKKRLKEHGENIENEEATRVRTFLLEKAQEKKDATIDEKIDFYKELTDKWEKSIWAHYLVKEHIFLEGQYIAFDEQGNMSVEPNASEDDRKLLNAISRNDILLTLMPNRDINYTKTTPEKFRKDIDNALKDLGIETVVNGKRADIEAIIAKIEAKVSAETTPEKKSKILALRSLYESMYKAEEGSGIILDQAIKSKAETDLEGFKKLNQAKINTNTIENAEVRKIVDAQFKNASEYFKVNPDGSITPKLNGEASGNQPDKKVTVDSFLNDPIGALVDQFAQMHPLAKMAVLAGILYGLFNDKARPRIIGSVAALGFLGTDFGKKLTGETIDQTKRITNTVENVGVGLKEKLKMSDTYKKTLNYLKSTFPWLYSTVIEPIANTVEEVPSIYALGILSNKNPTGRDVAEMYRNGDTQDSSKLTFKKLCDEQAGEFKLDNQTYKDAVDKYIKKKINDDNTWLTKLEGDPYGGKTFTEILTTLYPKETTSTPSSTPPVVPTIPTPENIEDTDKEKASYKFLERVAAVLPNDSSPAYIKSNGYYNLCFTIAGKHFKAPISIDNPVNNEEFGIFELSQAGNVASTKAQGQGLQKAYKTIENFKNNVVNDVTTASVTPPPAPTAAAPKPSPEQAIASGIAAVERYNSGWSDKTLNSGQINNIQVDRFLGTSSAGADYYIVKSEGKDCLLRVYSSGNDEISICEINNGSVKDDDWAAYISGLEAERKFQDIEIDGSGWAWGTYVPWFDDDLTTEDLKDPRFRNLATALAAKKSGK